MKAIANSLAKDTKIKTQCSLLTKKRFLPLFLTQFSSAFIDNFFKNALVLLIIFQHSAVLNLPSEQMVALSTGIFMLPFFVFSAFAGQLADKYEKSFLTKIIKGAEIFIVILAAAGFWYERFDVLLVCLFLMGMHSAFFGPIKYAILPQHLKEEELLDANALISAATFLAILMGAILGGVCISIEKIGTQLVCGLLVLTSLGGFVAACFIPKANAPDPSLKLNLNPLSLTWEVMKLTRVNQTIFNAIIGLSWFWFLGGAVFSTLPPYVKQVLMGTEMMATFFFILFTVGIALGAILCGKLSGGRLELGLIPIGAMGISVFLFAIGQIDPTFVDGQVTHFSLQNVSIMLAFLLLSAAAGLYSVPLMALIQQRAPSKNCSRIIAGGNVISSFAMVLASFCVFLYFRLGISVKGFFILISVFNFCVAIYLFRWVPEFLYRFCTFVLAKFTYKIQVTGLDNIPKEGPAVLICNHISWLDWMIVYGSVPRPVCAMVDYYIMQHPIIGPILRDARVITLATVKESEIEREEAFQQVKKELEAGGLVLIFPEGKIATHADMNPFKRGIERIVKETPVPVIPMAISNMWGSVFSRAPMHRNWLNRMIQPRREVALHIGAPVPPEEAKVRHLERIVKALKIPESFYTSLQKEALEEEPSLQ